MKHHSGRILGPLDLERLKKLIQKNQITGVELAKEYPDGIWQDINRIPEIAELLLGKAAGSLESSRATLKSEQSSYRPILGSTKEQFAPTVVLPTTIPETLEGTRESEKSESGATGATGATIEQKPDFGVVEKRPVDEKPPDVDATRVVVEDDDRTWIATEETRTVIATAEERAQAAIDAKLVRSGDFQSGNYQESPLPDTLADEKFKRIVQEATIALNRPGLSPAKKRFRLPPRKEMLRIVLIAAALGYFGYDSFLKEERDGAAEILKKAQSFRPSLPKITNAKPNSKLSQQLYDEGIRHFMLDHVLGYKASAIRFSQAVTADPENLKAYAMLASAYVNLIDTSTKDETFFSVISQLIETAKAKGIELPEIVIAEVEFLTVTGRPDAAVQKIVDYTKGRPSFDPSLFIYIAEAFLAKNKPQDASKYINNFPDHRAWSPRIFYLRGRITEELGDAAAATEQYDKALKGWPTHARSRLRKVYLAWKGGSISKSGSDLEKLLKNPDFLAPKDLAQAYYLLSQFHSVNQNFEGGLGAVEKALKLDRSNRDYLLEYYTLQGRAGGSVANAKNEARMYLFLSSGESLLKEGKTSDALAQFLLARAENPKSIAPLVKIGDMFLQLNDLINARLNYQKAAEMAPNSIEVWSKYISVLIQSYEWDEAQKAMDKFRKLPVSQSSIDKAAGDMYAKQSRFLEASTFYRKAMSRETIDPDVYIAYGKILLAVKSYKDAPFFFALARRFDPLNPEPVILTSKAVAEIEGLDAGIQYLQDELQRGSVARAELSAAIAELEIKKGQWSVAQTFIDQARQANPDYAYPWKLQAQIFLNDENTDKKALDRALEAFKSYSDRNASDPSGYLERYRIFMKKAQFEKAEIELNKIYAIYPKYPNLHYYKGIMYSNMANHKVAAEEYIAELKNNPNSVPTLIALGKALIELGDGKGALTHLAKAMGMQPQNQEAKLHAAVANQKMKNYPGAIALFQTAISLDPGNPLLYKRMGECYRDMGDMISARTAFQKYLQMEPDASDKAEIERYL